jgi:hypothetical protein
MSHGSLDRGIGTGPSRRLSSKSPSSESKMEFKDGHDDLEARGGEEKVMSRSNSSTFVREHISRRYLDNFLVCFLLLLLSPYRSLHIRLSPFMHIADALRNSTAVF